MVTSSNPSVRSQGWRLQIMASRHFQYLRARRDQWPSEAASTRHHAISTAIQGW